MPVSATCTTAERVKITAAPLTDEVPPKPATLDGALTVTVQSGDGTSTPDDADPLSVYVQSDAPGDTVFLVEGDADLGSGVETISDTVTLTVAALKAANLGLAAGTAEPRPPA